MLWLTLRQLKSGSVEARKRAAKELWHEANPRALNALAEAALSDADPGVRQIAVSALGRMQDPARYDPLMKALEDKDPEVLRSAMLGLRRANDDRVIQGLVPLLRHQEFTVRTSAAKAIDTLRWAPRDREERAWFYVAKGWYERATASGPEAITPLQVTVRTSPVSAAVRAIDALGLIADPSVVGFLCETLESKEPAVCIAVADALGKIGGGDAVKALTGCLRSELGQVRAAAAQALGALGAAETTGLICRMLEDQDWEVRREAAAALGKLNNPEAVGPLTRALEDLDSDVREAAAMALGKIGHRSAIGPLVLTLKDDVTSVRRIAAAGLARIDPDWPSLPETRAAAEGLKAAIHDAEPAVRFFVAQLLVNLGELEPDAIGGFAPGDQHASPAIQRRRMATNLFIAMLDDTDRDIRQAAAESLGRLGGERARQALTRAAGDADGDVAAATQMALQALGTEGND